MSNAQEVAADEFFIREGRPEDYESLSAIKMDATRLFGPDYITQPIEKDIFNQYLANDALQVAVDNSGLPCGYSGVYRADNDLFLHHLFVRMKCGGRGLGALLLQAVIEKAEILKLRAVTLITSGSAPWNAPFYAKYGFRILDGGLPPYLQRRLDDDLKYFDPESDFVKKSPLVLPRVAMERLVR